MTSCRKSLRSLLLVGLVSLGSPAIAPAQTVTVSLSQKQQVIEGFGGFGPDRVWWDSGPYFDQAWLDKLDDLGVTIVRTQIYWDFQKEDRTFNLARTSDNGKQIDYLKALHERGIKILATAWTPPVWMKNAPDDRLAPFCHGQCGGTLAPEHYQDFANFLVEYVLQMRNAGVDIYAVNFANEPLFANPFESCVYSEKSYAAVLRVVGESFSRSGLTTKLFGPEHMGSADWNAGFFKRLLDDTDTARFLGFYAVHGYSDGVAADYGDAEGWERLHQHTSKAGVELWMTETSDFKSQGWDKAFLTAKELHLALRFGRISGWVYWYMAGDVMGEAPESTPRPLYYAFKQYYRFVRPGCVQVGSVTDDREILPTAFSCDGGLTVVLINNGNAAKNVTIQLSEGGMPAFKGYRTSRTENTVEIGTMPPGRVDLPAQSITTLLVPGTETSQSTGAGMTGGRADAMSSRGSNNTESAVHRLATGPTSRGTGGSHGTTKTTAVVLIAVAVLLAVGWIHRSTRT